MKTMAYSGNIDVVVANLEPGEPLLESIREIIKKHGIRNGVLVSGVATLKRSHMHFIEGTDYPPDNTFYVVEKPLEVASISGIIAEGQPHLHMVIGHRDEKAWAGHVEDDCIVAYLAELCILKFNGLEMARHWDEERQLGSLGPK